MANLHFGGLRQFLFRMNFSLLCLLLNTIVVAAPSDHGRYDILETDHSFGFFEIVGCGILITIILFWILSLFTSSTNNKGNSTNSATKGKSIYHSKGTERNNYSNVVKNYNACPKCSGLGWVKGKQLTWGDTGFHKCPHCKGYGRELDASAQSIVADLERLKNEKSNASSLIAAMRSMKLQEKLSKVPICVYCKGEGRIFDYEIIEGYAFGEKYIKERCERCNGTGKLYYT